MARRRRGCGLEITSRLKPLLRRAWWSRVPFFSVIADGEFLPAALGFAAADGPEVFRGARPFPIQPPAAEPVFHGIVVDVIQGREKMGVRLQRAFHRLPPHLAPGRTFFQVPCTGCPPVEAPENAADLQRVAAPGEEVVVVRQDNPCVDFHPGFPCGLKQAAAEVFHSLIRKCDVRPVFEACGGGEVASRCGAKARRGMVRIPGGPARFEGIVALAVRHAPPFIHAGKRNPPPRDGARRMFE